MKTKDLKFVDFEVNKISNTQLRTINGGYTPIGGNPTTTTTTNDASTNPNDTTTISVLPNIGGPKDGQLTASGAGTIENP